MNLIRRVFLFSFLLLFFFSACSVDLQFQTRDLIENNLIPVDPHDVSITEEELRDQMINAFQISLQGQRHKTVNAIIIKDPPQEPTPIEAVILYSFPISFLYENLNKDTYHPLSNPLMAIEIPSPPDQTIKRGDRMLLFDLPFQVLHKTRDAYSNKLQIILRIQEKDGSIKEMTITEENGTEEKDPMNNQLEDTEDKININRATIEELQEITGIGPVYAERIMEYRNTQGPFQHIKDIKKVSGIGEVRFQGMKNEITVVDK